MSSRERGRDFRLLAGAVGLSALGDWVAIAALGLHVKGTTGSGLAVAGLWIALFGPSVVVAGFAGALVDRVETRRLLALAAVAGTLVAGLLALVTGTAAVLALTALLGLVFAVLQPAEFALVPAVAGASVQEANGRIETARYVGFGAGPVLGGLLFTIGGLELAMLVDAATFAAVIAIAGTLRVRRDPLVLAQPERTPRPRDGIAVLLRDRVLALAMAVAFGSLFFMSAVWVGEVFFVQDVLGRGDVAYGLMLTVWTAGLALGALVLSPRVAAGSVATVALAAVAVQGTGLALPALWLSFAFFLACSAIGGLAHGLKNVMFRSLIHVRVPAALHGRAFAAYNGIRNAAEVRAFAAGGLLVAAVGPQPTLAYAGGLSALVGLAGLLVLVRMYRGAVARGPAGHPAVARG